MHRWAGPTMLGSVALIALSPAISLAGFAFYHDVPVGPFMFGAAIVGLTAAAYGRSQWKASLLVAGIATVLGTISMFGATRLYERHFSPPPAAILRYRNRLSAEERQDLDLLRKGDLAYRTGKSLTVPEGGYLLPYQTKPMTGLTTTLRFASTEDRSQLAAWSRELNVAEAKAKNPVQVFEVPPLISVLPSVAGYIGLLSFGLAVASNVVATIATKLRRTA